MIIELKIPAAGESITEVAIGNWLIEDGAFVEKDQEIAEVETDKATLPLIAPNRERLKYRYVQVKRPGLGMWPAPLIRIKQCQQHPNQ